VGITILPGIKSENGYAQSNNNSTTGFVVNRSVMQVSKSMPPDPLCEPGEPFSVAFTDQIAADNTTDLVSITPEVSNLEVSYANNTLVLRGDTKPDTTYQVGIGPGFKGMNKKVEVAQFATFQTRSYLPRLLPPAHTYLSMSPSSPLKFPVMSVNVKHSACVPMMEIPSKIIGTGARWSAHSRRVFRHYWTRHTRLPLITIK
jgi:hypothetical protein